MLFRTPSRPPVSQVLSLPDLDPKIVEQDPALALSELGPGFVEELVVADLNMGEATALYADKSLLDGYALSSWWREGMARVKVHGRGGSLAKGKVATKLQRYENEKLEISDDF